MGHEIDVALAFSSELREWNTGFKMSALLYSRFPNHLMPAELVRLTHILIAFSYFLIAANCEKQSDTQ